ncbi:10540_t:CDS:1, partial [Acaulospora colombiana]
NYTTPISSLSNNGLHFHRSYPRLALGPGSLEILRVLACCHDQAYVASVDDILTTRILQSSTIYLFENGSYRTVQRHPGIHRKFRGPRKSDSTAHLRGFRSRIPYAQAPRDILECNQTVLDHIGQLCKSSSSIKHLIRLKINVIMLECKSYIYLGA